MAAPRGAIVLMGSGEFTATMVEVHRELLSRSGDAPEAVFLDTPAGFQLNVDEISRKAVEFFRTRVQRRLSVVSLKSAEVAPAEAERAYGALRRADYILTGPGSPTYAVRQWRQTPVPEILARRAEEGASLVVASAAALTVGRFTLPVYEIYKVGEHIRWEPGLEILGRFGFDLVVIPHWNNAEGGTHDTRFCYMGAPRFDRLEALLPASTGVLGIDEHTAFIIDLAKGEAAVRGLGQVTLRRAGAEVAFERGERVSLRSLGGASSPPEAPEGVRQPLDRPARSECSVRTSLAEEVRRLTQGFHDGVESRDPKEVADAVLELDRVLWDAQQDPRESDALSQGRQALREMMASLSSRLGPAATGEGLAPLVELVLDLRTDLRKQGKWSEADAIRRRLQAMDIVVEDEKDGSRWRLAR